MKFNKTIIASIAMLSIVAGASTFAYQGNPATKNPNPTDPVRHEAMTKALETKDYSARKTLMEWKWVLNRITTQEQFQKFVAMKAAFDKWDTATASKLQAELGIWQKKMDGSKRWMWKGINKWMWNYKR